MSETLEVKETQDPSETPEPKEVQDPSETAKDVETQQEAEAPSGEKTRRRRWRPFQGAQTEQMESWLEDRARRGEYLMDLGMWIARFEKRPPGEIRYRVFQRSILRGSGELIRCVEEAGWTFVACSSYDLVFSCEDPDLPEPKTEGTNYRQQLLRSMWIRGIFYLACLALILFCLFEPERGILAHLRDPAPLHPLLEALNYLGLLLLLIAFVGVVCIELYYPISYYRRFLKGELRHGISYKREARVNLLIDIVLFLAFFLCVFF